MHSGSNKNVIASPSRSVETRSRAVVVGASIAVHIFLVAVALVLPARIMPRKDSPKPVEVVFYPRTEPQPVAPPDPVVPEEPDPVPDEIVEQRPPVVEPPRPAPPEPRPAPPRPVVRGRPRPEPAATPPAIRPTEPPPRRKVRTDLFEKPEPAPAIRPTRERQTRTGAFGTTRTTVRERPSADPEKARVGGFDVEPLVEAVRAEDRNVRTGVGFDENPTAADRQPLARDASVKDTAFDASEAEPAPRPTSRDRGSVTSTAFNDSSSRDSAPAKSAEPGSVKQGQFGDGFRIAEATRPRARNVAKPDTPVEIVSKPKPEYTDAARQQKIEGEVVLEVVFVASGELRVLRVLGSLGHGLDEAAVEAARKINFKPARRDGRPIDHTARLHIVFRLA